MQSKNSISSLRVIPMSREDAGLLVKRLMGSYPSLNIHDPQVYVCELMTVLLRYSRELAEKGIAQARQASPKFIPSVPEVEQECEALAKPTREALTYAQQWGATAHKQLENRRRLEEEERTYTPEHRREVVRRFFAALKKSGATTEKEKAQETVDEFCARHNVTRAEFDAIPDAPETPDYWRGIRWARP